ncbi:MAG TPA: hypothetical protein VGM03_11715 [Phycisphaerae bacterium]
MAYAYRDRVNASAHVVPGYTNAEAAISAGDSGNCLQSPIAHFPVPNTKGNNLDLTSFYGIARLIHERPRDVEKPIKGCAGPHEP